MFIGASFLDPIVSFILFSFALEQPGKPMISFICMLLCLRKYFWILHRKDSKILREGKAPKRRQPPYLLNHKSKGNLTAVGLLHGVFHV